MQGLRESGTPLIWHIRMADDHLRAALTARDSECAEEAPA
jgi:hypothetical protein